MPTPLLTTLVPMQSIFGTINNLAGQTVTTGQYVAIAIAVVLFISVAIACRLKASTMLVTFFICGFFVWGAFNMDFGKKTVGDTLNTQPAPTANQNP